MLVCVCLLLYFVYGPVATQHFTLSLHDALPISSIRRIGSWSCATSMRCWTGSPIRPFRTTTGGWRPGWPTSMRSSRSEEHTSELQSRFDLVCRLLLEKKKCLGSDRICRFDLRFG